MPHDAIPRTIRELVAHFQDEGEVTSAYEINCGYCDLFAERLLTALARLTPVPRAGEIFVDDLLQRTEEGEDAEPMFDREGVRSWHPGAVPPEGLDWDDMDRIAALYNFAGGTHVWVEIDDRHYDAECPEGVDNLFDLPFFKRKFEHFLASRPAAP